MTAADEILRLVDEGDMAPDEALEQLARQDSGWREALAGSFGRTLGDQPSEMTRKPVSAIGKTTLGIGGIAGGSYVGGEFMKSRQEQFEAMERKEQREALASIMNDQTLSEEEKRGLLNQLANEGFFTTDRKQGNPSFLGKIFGDPLANMGPMKWLLVLIILYYAGNALVESAGDGGGN